MRCCIYPEIRYVSFYLDMYKTPNKNVSGLMGLPELVETKRKGFHILPNAPKGVFGKQKMEYTFMGHSVPVVRKWLCSETLLKKEVPGCMCDLECILFRDCCVDAFEHVLGEIDNGTIKLALIDPETLYVEMRPFSLEASYLTLFYSYGSCHELNVNNRHISVTIIDKCPQRKATELNSDVQLKCSNYSSDVISSIPVTLIISTRWQIVFRNIFCSLCHGLKKEDIVLWDARAKCPAGFNITKLNNTGEFKFSTCIGVYHQPANLGHLRQCINEKVLKTTCNEVSKPIMTESGACSVYIAPVRIGGHAYRNIHCAYCDNHLSQNLGKPYPMAYIPSEYTPSSHSSFAHGFSPGMKPSPAPITQPASMMILFDFTSHLGLIFKSEDKTLYHASNQCDDMSVYDFITDSCKPVVCSFDRVWESGMCKKDEIVFLNDSNIFPISNVDKVMLLYVLFESQQNFNISYILEGYMNMLNDIIAKYTEDANYRHNSGALQVSSVIEQLATPNKDELNTTSISQIVIILSYDNQLPHLIDIVGTFTRLVFQSNRGTVDILNVTLSNKYTNQTFSCNGDRQLKYLYDVSVSVHDDTVYLIDAEANIAYNTLDTRFSFRFEPDTKIPEVDDVLICTSLQCPQIKLSDDEYTIENETLVLRKNGQRLSLGNYEVRGKSVYICASKTEKKRMSFLYTYGAKVLQDVTYALSIIALALTILIYIKSSTVRTLHGKSLVSLSISLIAAQLTGLLQNETGNIFCKIIAIIMHYSWLAAFGWMSMISYDMKRTFCCSQTIVSNTHTDRKRYMIYCIYGWLIPGIIVLTCVILDNLDVPDILQIGYGENGACFLGGLQAVILFFSIPHMSSIVFNTVAFVFTVHALAKKRKVSPSSKRSNSPLYCLIYLKLSVVMGVTWLFAILASIMNQPFFWTLHLVLNGLQGVFVFLSFALRSSLWKNIKLKRRSKGSDIYSVSGSTASVL